MRAKSVGLSRPQLRVDVGSSVPVSVPTSALNAAVSLAASSCAYCRDHAEDACSGRAAQVAVSRFLSEGWGLTVETLAWTRREKRGVASFNAASLM